MGLQRLRKLRKKARIIGTRNNGDTIPANGTILGARKIKEYREQASRDLAERLSSMDSQERHHYDVLRNSEAADIADGWEECNDSVEMDIDEILNGSAGIELSHEGSEFFDLIEDYFSQQRKPRKDNRTRQDRTEARNRAFMGDIDGICDAYLAWYASLGELGFGGHNPAPSQSAEQGIYSVLVVDTYNVRQINVSMRQGDSSISASFLRQGIVPCSPHSPTVAITVPVLELFRNLSLRCPRMSIQSFVKSLCDIHSVPFCAYLSNQFSICVDLYLSILDVVDRRIQNALGRNTKNWRLKNACPACTYKLQNEPPLRFSMLVTMDGNDSLKRIQKRQANSGVANEHLDTREVGGDYYLSRTQVDRWAKEVIVECLAEGLALDEAVKDDSPNLCEDRWKNMATELVARMWGIFDETGIFLSLCRHGFVLVVADMVKSGELSKYPLSVVETLLDAFGPDIGGGYDIGCQFKSTLASSPLGKKAKDLNYQSLVGSFHGHAHNRLCQLQHLATYVKGLGLEDLEGCERMFSKSNHLASSIRHASIFHRRQKIQCFFKHMDQNETYQRLSTFLVENYKQALEILSGEDAFKKQMKDQGLTDTLIFETWLSEERKYLENLQREPLPETLAMEYLKNLIHLDESQKARGLAVNTWTIEMTASSSSSQDLSKTRKAETARRHAYEKELKYLGIVQELEFKLGVTRRWTPGDREWKEAMEMTVRRRYQRCLDTLEGLIVSRMFELTKMNMSQTGYKMRKHIGNALKARSKAIRAALDQYNSAARALTPPRAELSWESVVEYAFLADFDLLADTREDVRMRPWARPAARELRDQYYKMERAREEIQRLNVEIPRLATYIQNEELFLAEAENSLRSKGQIHLSVQLKSRLTRLINSNDIHLRKLQKLKNMAGFTGSIAPGHAINPMNPTTTPGPSLLSRRSSETEGDPSNDSENDLTDHEAEDEVYAVVELSASESHGLINHDIE